MQVESLQPDNSRKILPLDAGIISWVKCKYEYRLILPVTHNIEACSNIIYNVYVLAAVCRETERINCPSSVMQNCFKHYFGEKTKEVSIETEVALDVDADAQMFRDSSAHDVEVRTATLNDMHCLEIG